MKNNETIRGIIFKWTRQWTLPAKGNYAEKLMIEFAYYDLENSILCIESTELENFENMITDEMFSFLKPGISNPVVELNFELVQKGRAFLRNLISVNTTGKKIKIT